MREPFLKTGTTNAFFQSIDDFPCCREALNIKASAGAI